MDADGFDDWVEEPRRAPLPSPPSNDYGGGGRRGGGGRGRGGGGRGRGGNSSFRNNRDSDFDSRGDGNDFRGGDNNWDDGNKDSYQNDRGNSGRRGRGNFGGNHGRSDSDRDFNGARGGSSFNRSHNGGGDDFDEFNGGNSGGGSEWTNGNDSFGNDWDSSEPRGRGRGRFTRSDDDNFEKKRSGGRGRGRFGGGDDGDFGNNAGERGEEQDEKPRERYIPPEPTDDENLMFGNTISSGINFSKYDSIQVKVSGDNVPKPVTSFEECQLRNLLLENVKKSGYTKPTPVQKYALPIISSGRDLMACAQTGSGKTAAFLLPIIQKLMSESPDANPGRPVGPQVIICSPTRELAIQIFQEARKFAHGSCLKICIAYGGTVSFHQARNIERGCHILVATPGRLNDFTDKEFVTFSSVQYFVLDEADRMLDMGFLPAIEKMLQHQSMTPIGERQTLMFSATFPEDIQRLASKYLNDYLFLAVGIVGGACADVEQIFFEVPKFEKRQKLVEILSENSSSETELTLVFVEKKRTADFIAAFLSENNYPTTSIHGDRLQSQREEALADFKSGRMPILVATAVAARGLDIKNVSHVINYDMPSAIEEYVHRIGRTGRVGNSGRATSFFEPNDDQALAGPLVRILEQTGQNIPTFLEGARNASCDGPPGFSKNQDFGGRDWRNQDSPRGTRPIETEEQW